MRDDKNQIHTVRYEAVNAMLLNEFLKQHRKVQAQDKELHELRQCIETQKAESEELKSRLSVLEELVAKPHQKGN